MFFWIAIIVFCTHLSASQHTPLEERSNDDSPTLLTHQFDRMFQEFDNFCEHPMLGNNPRAYRYFCLAFKAELPKYFKCLLEHYPHSDELHDIGQRTLQSQNCTLILEVFSYLLPSVEPFAQNAIISSPKRCLSIKTNDGAILRSQSLFKFTQLLQHTLCTQNASPSFTKIASALYAIMPQQFTIKGQAPIVRCHASIVSASNLISWLKDHPLIAISFLKAATVSERAQPSNSKLIQKMQLLATGHQYLQAYAPHPVLKHPALQNYCRLHSEHALSVLNKTTQYHQCEPGLDAIFPSIIQSNNITLFIETILLLHPNVVDYATKAWVHNGQFTFEIQSSQYTVKADCWLAHFCSFILDFFNITPDNDFFRKIATGLCVLMDNDITHPDDQELLLSIQKKCFSIYKVVSFLTTHSDGAKGIHSSTIPEIIEDHFNIAQQHKSFAHQCATMLQPWAAPLLPIEILQKAQIYVTKDLLIACQHAQSLSPTLSAPCLEEMAKKPILCILTLHHLCPRAQGHYQIQWSAKTLSITSNNSPLLTARSNSTLDNVLRLLFDTCLRLRMPDFPQMARALFTILDEDVLPHAPTPSVIFLDPPHTNPLFSARHTDLFSSTMYTDLLPQITPSHTIIDHELCTLANTHITPISRVAPNKCSTARFVPTFRRQAFTSRPPLQPTAGITLGAGKHWRPRC